MSRRPVRTEKAVRLARWFGGAGGERGGAGLSPAAVGYLDRQFGVALDLAGSCRLLSECSQTAGDPLTAVVLDRLATELTDEAAVLAPLVGSRSPATVPPFLEPSASDLTCLAQLDHRLCQAGLVAQTDAMSPDLEATVAALLWSLATLYHTRREHLLVCTLLDSA